MNISTKTITETKIGLNNKDIIKGINTHLNIGKIPDNAKVFVTIPIGGNYSNMKLDIDYMVLLEIWYDNDSIVHVLNEENVFQLLYGDKKTPNGLKVYVCIPGGGDWSGQKLDIDEETNVYIEFEEKDIFKADKEWGFFSEWKNQK